jgi:phosphatidylglycerol:prolipoprotein diacylglycerol transferase
MISYPNIDPIAISIGPIAVRWYGITYLMGLAVGWVLGCYRIKKHKVIIINQTELTDLILYIAFGLLIGGRLGYMLFYKTGALFTHPWEALMLWQGGMSFHGGLIGAVIAMFCFCWQYKKDFFAITDFIAPLAPPAFLFGRIGNFINGELWGKVTDLPWGMVFPYAGDLPRHPTQLYEGFLEGVLLFTILWLFTMNPNKSRPKMAVSGLFCLCYGIFRCLVEFLRVPDNHLGYIAFDWLTMGQILSLPLIVFGLILLLMAYKFNNKK